MNAVGVNTDIGVFGVDAGVNLGWPGWVGVELKVDVGVTPTTGFGAV